MQITTTNKAECDVLAEREKQRVGGWDEKNEGLVLDQYNGITLRYLGGATASYRNDPAEKREMLVKAAAVILQTIERIDEGKLDLNVPRGIPLRAA